MRLPLCLAAALVLAACADLPTGQVNGTFAVPGSTSTVAAPAAAIAGTPLVGVVTAPAGVIAAGAGNYHLAEVGEAPLANAEVFLADAGGNAIPGIASVRTDAAGKFTFPEVPKDFTFVVACKAQTKEGKPALLQSLAKPGALGASVDVSAASTLVTAGVVDGTDLGEFNPATFKAALESTRKRLTDKDLPDLSDRAACVKRIGELAGELKELGTALAEMKQSMKDLKKDLEELKKQLANRPAPKPPEERPPVTVAGEPPKEECAGTFKRFDLDGDGVITTAEWGKTHPNLTEEDRRNFKARDRNADGRITFDEACGLNPPPPPVRPSEAPRPVESPRPTATPRPTEPPRATPTPATTPSPMRCEDYIKLKDLDHDGVVTYEEWLKTYPSPRPGSTEAGPEAGFKKIDLNGDGRVSVQELCGPRPTPTPVEVRQ